MATYKIPQDVEAEDNLIGPFTVKQSIFLFIAAFFGTAAFFMFQVSPFFLLISLPPFLLFLFLGLYRPKDQPIEVYLAARIRFLFKPRKRVWDASGLTPVQVKIDSAAPTVEATRPDLGNEQVASRLDNLSALMDSRGWAARGASQNQPGDVTPGFQKSVRIAGSTAVQQQQEDYAEFDILDPLNNQTANTIMQLNRASQIEHRRSVIEQMRNPVAQTAVQQSSDYSPATSSIYQSQAQAQAQNPINQAANPAIMQLSQSNDLTVSGIARQANGQS